MLKPWTGPGPKPPYWDEPIEVILLCLTDEEREALRDLLDMSPADLAILRDRIDRGEVA
jgi:hypothetical protein